MFGGKGDAKDRKNILTRGKKRKEIDSEGGNEYALCRRPPSDEEIKEIGKNIPPCIN